MELQISDMTILDIYFHFRMTIHSYFWRGHAAARIPHCGNL